MLVAWILWLPVMLISYTLGTKCIFPTGMVHWNMGKHRSQVIHNWLAYWSKPLSAVTGVHHWLAYPPLVFKSLKQDLVHWFEVTPRGSMPDLNKIETCIDQHLSSLIGCDTNLLPDHPCPEIDWALYFCTSKNKPPDAPKWTTLCSRYLTWKWG